MVKSVAVIQDRSMLVPIGQRVYTEYVNVWSCELACRERMAVGDVKGAFEKLLQCGTSTPWPCVRGYWKEDKATFVIEDGRHEYIASLMLGKEYILVAWVE